MMTPEELFSFYQNMNNQRIWLAFKGAVSQETLVELGGVIKDRLGFDSKIKKVFAIFIEMAQNIFHYSAETELLPDKTTAIGVGIIVVTGMDNNYQISSGNLVEKARAEQLSAHCVHINSLDNAQLKEFYSKSRNASPPPGSKGAGLGLIDIARKADLPLVFSINPVDDTHSFFTLTAIVHKSS